MVLLNGIKSVLTQILFLTVRGLNALMRSRAVAYLLAITMGADLLLILRNIHDYRFYDYTPAAYLLMVFDVLTQRVGQAFLILAIGVVLAISVYRGSAISGDEPSFEDVYRSIIRKIGALLRMIFTRAILRSLAILAFLAIGIVLVNVLLDGPGFRPFLAQAASKILIDPAKKRIFVVDDTPEVEKLLKVPTIIAWFDLDRPHERPQSFLLTEEIGSGNVALSPERLALVPPRDCKNSETGSQQHFDEQILAADSRHNMILLFDPGTLQLVGTVSDLLSPHFVVVTRDGKYAYVSSEQPIPAGTIDVIDLCTFKKKTQITGVDCPEGAAISGTRLYVSTQCGAGQDPVFVVDTIRNRVVYRVPGFAVGSRLGITPDRKVYVARGDSVGVLDATFRPPKKCPTLDLPADVVAFTFNGDYAIIGGDHQLAIVDTKTDQIVNKIPLATSPYGVATIRQRGTDSDLLYVWLPEEKRIYLSSLNGLTGNLTNGGF